MGLYNYVNVSDITTWTVVVPSRSVVCELQPVCIQHQLTNKDAVSRDAGGPGVLGQVTFSPVLDNFF